MFGVLVRTTTGWAPVLDNNSEPLLHSTPELAIASVQGTYPVSKVKLYEMMTLNSDLTWEGGSLGTLGQRRTNLAKKVGIS